MKVLLCGSNGQLGTALKKFYPKNFQFYYRSKQELNICNFDSLRNCINEIKPNLIINAAAYNAVDEAEKNKKIAKQVNFEGPKNLSILSSNNNIKLIHISTDYVFDGKSEIPYSENDLTNPLTYYGKTKLMGENFIINNNDNYIIFRVSWLYGPYKKNFLTQMLYTGLKKKKIKVVSDQFSIPTSTFDFSKLIWIASKKMLQSSKFNGLYHYSGSGKAISWYDFAKAIFFNAKKIGYNSPLVIPISSDQYKSIAKRPKYSCLNINKSLKTFDFFNQSWKVSLKEVLKEFFANNNLYL